MTSAYHLFAPRGKTPGRLHAAFRSGRPAPLLLMHQESRSGGHIPRQRRLLLRRPTLELIEESRVHIGRHELQVAKNLQQQIQVRHHPANLELPQRTS